MKTPTQKYLATFSIITSLFFMWGFITCMNDILIPYLKGVFHLNHAQSMLVQFSFFTAYFVGSVMYFIISATKGDPINKIGYKNGIVTGLLLSGTGSLLFYPAAELCSFPMFLGALFVLGLGFTLLQISANPYAAILGPESTASARLNLAQGFNSLGTTLAPLIGGFLVFRYFSGDAFQGADSVKVPYLIFSGIFFLLAVVFIFLRLPSFFNNDKISSGLGVLRHRHLVLGMIAIFMYVGAEVSIGSIMISFLKLPEIAGFSEDHASTFVAFYWGGLMIGRFAGGISLSRFRNAWIKPLLISLTTVATTALIFFSAWLKGNTSLVEMLPFLIFVGLNLLAFIAGRGLPARTMQLFAMLIIGLLITAMLTQGITAMWCIIGIGLFNSIMWSNIFSMSIAGLKEQTAQASSLLVMMIFGGALLPLSQGALADAIGVHYSFIIPLAAYLYLIYYGWKGKVGQV